MQPFFVYIVMLVCLGEVVKAWELGVQTMKRNEMAVFYCKPSYAYDKQGKPPKVPPDATVIFEIELISWRGISSMFLLLFVHRHSVLQLDNLMNVKL